MCWCTIKKRLTHTRLQHTPFVTAQGCSRNMTALNGHVSSWSSVTSYLIKSDVLLWSQTLGWYMPRLLMMPYILLHFKSLLTLPVKRDSVLLRHSNCIKTQERYVIKEQLRSINWITVQWHICWPQHAAKSHERHKTMHSNICIMLQFT